MRYPEGQAPDPELAYSASMHGMLTLSMIFGIVVGIILLVAGIRGRIMWLKFWSAGLILASVAYLVADFLGFT